MLESLINPKRAEKGPWKMFFIGLLYASLSILLVHFIFGRDAVFSKSSGLMVVFFCVMFSLPFVYYLIKNEEEEDEEIEKVWDIWKVHSDAIYAFIWLFFGFIIAFSFWNVMLQNSNLLNVQVEIYCSINQPGNIQNCISEYALTGETISTNALSDGARLVSIIGNNVGVMMFTLIFSLIFGAGAIFVLAWNASVISAAIGIFTNYRLTEIPVGLIRYMIHGFPEIAAYFITALAGGIFGIGIIRNGFENKRTMKVIGHILILLSIALVVLIAAALIEVYLTPLLFK